MKSPIPDAVLSQHIIALGKTRSGKSSKVRLLAERILRAKLPVCIIDPKGDWWGIKSSADGKSAGFPIVIFGGEHADVPINEHSGAQVAELVATGNRSALIDLGGWTVSARTRFFIDFASTLFKLTKGKRFLIIDEVHNFAPKAKVFDIEAGKMLHWANRLASEGQGKGLILIAASQRPQKVHNDLLTSCETLIACRVIHKADRDAIKDWIDGCADPQIGREVLATLASMERSEAWVWSPEAGYGPERVKFPMFSTFDSFKPRDAKAAEVTGWADVDLDEVKAKLAAVIEKAKADDPVALRSMIRDLQKQLAAKPKESIKTPVGIQPDALAKIEKQHDRRITALRAALEDAMKVIVNISMKDFLSGSVADQARIESALRVAMTDVEKQINQRLDDQRRDFGAWRKEGQKLLARIEKLLADGDMPIDVHVRQQTSIVVEKPSFAPVKTPVITMEKPEGSPTGLQKDLINALAWLGDKGIVFAPRPMVAVVAGKSHKGGYFGNTVSAMKAAGLIEYPPSQPGTLALTDDGMRYADEIDSSGEVHERWLSMLSGLEKEIVSALIERHPEAMTRQEVGDAIGKSIEGGYFNNTVSRLKTLGAVDYPAKGSLALTEYVMPR